MRAYLRSQEIYQRVINIATSKKAFNPILKGLRTPGLAYDLFSIISIKAIQEQQEMIKERIEWLEKELDSIKDLLQDK